MTIIYEDEKIIAVNKAPGITVIPGRGVEESATLIRRLETAAGKKIFTVHRLDRDTSGVIVFAKDAQTHRDLCIQFERKEAKKMYLAAVAGVVEGEGKIEKPVYEFGSERMGVDERGKRSITLYKVLKRYRDASLLEVTTMTGRRHQIRVHLYSIGHAVLGDRLYGDVRPVGGIHRLMLHAYQITISLAGEKKTFTVDPDQEWDQILGSLGKMQ